MIPSETDVFYLGTDADRAPERPAQVHCRRCLVIIDPVIGCVECKPVKPSSTLCREGHHDRCDGRWARTERCGCGCHESEVYD